MREGMRGKKRGKVFCEVWFKGVSFGGAVLLGSDMYRSQLIKGLYSVFSKGTRWKRVKRESLRNRLVG